MPLQMNLNGLHTLVSVPGSGCAAAIACSFYRWFQIQDSSANVVEITCLTTIVVVALLVSTVHLLISDQRKLKSPNTNPQ